MTTQAISAKVGNKMMTRTFAATATDGVIFSGSNLIDTNASQNLGILIPGTVIDQMQVTYTAGLCQWRIIDSNNNAVARQGFASKTQYVCPMEAKIAPYTIKPTDLLQVFCKAVNSTAGDAEVMAWVTTSKGTESFQATTAADSTLIAMTNSITSQTLGDFGFGQMLTRLQFQVEDGGFIDEVVILDQTGSKVWQCDGNTRLPTAGGKSTLYNLDIPVGIKIEKGYALQVSTITA